MSICKHTPGPWKVFTTKTGRKIVGIGREEDGEGICDAGFGIWAWDDPAGIANARLIAAAPDLLDSLDPDTLEAIADEIDCFEHSARCASLRILAERQRAAIAKAEGAP